MTGHTHTLPENVITRDKTGAPQNYIVCYWKHQLSDNMSRESATRLFESLVKVDNTEPWQKRLGMWLIGRGNSDAE